MAEASLLDKISALAKRRGFVFPSADIYGGTGAVWDYGHLGLLLKNNIKEAWFKRFVQSRDDIVAVESALLTKRDVLVASGHVAEFADDLVECKECHTRLRADQIETIEDHTAETGHKDYTDPKKFNLMFKTYLGPVESEDNIAYLRPETAQGMFTNFANVLETSRLKLPFGIAQVGKSFRNEITTKSWIFRSREFEIAEIEYFVTPGEDEKWFKVWIEDWEKFFLDLGLSKAKLRLYEHPKESLAHYSKGTTDIEYEFPFGFSEIAGIANRTDFDLKQHENLSNQDLKYFDEVKKEKFNPFVIEPTLGVERAMMAVLFDAYTEEKGEDGEVRVSLKIKPSLAPYKAAIFPLLANKEDLVKKARGIYEDLRAEMMVYWDDRGNIGKRYRYQDEIGTPFCITVDFDSLEDDTVTLRDRDSMTQERVKISELKSLLKEKIK
jgi:glycyl-tRNA synthetase